MPLFVFAATASAYTVKYGDTLKKIAYTNHITKSQLLAANPQIKNGNKVRAGTTITIPAPSIETAPVLVGMQTKTTTPVVPATTPVVIPKPPVVVAPKPVSTTPVAVVGAAGETRFTAYITGYGWPDNTPKGSAEISNPIIHQLAGGTGTFADPITLAVGHSISGNIDTLDYKAGTKFYMPNLQKYFIVEDTCGDGNTPQNGPCHSGYQGNVWLDIWVGGNSSNQSATLACEDAITDTHLVIQNPGSTYKVVAGDVASTCKQFGDTVVMQ